MVFPDVQEGCNRMKTLIPFLPFYVGLIPVVVYIVKHEKEHTRIWLLLKQVCSKLHIINGE